MDRKIPKTRPCDLPWLGICTVLVQYGDLKESVAEGSDKTSAPNDELGHIGYVFSIDGYAMNGLCVEDAFGRDELGSLSVVESQIWPFCSDQEHAAGRQRGHGPGHPPNTIAYTNMSLGQPGVPLDAEHADNFEDIEKQFAVKVVQHMETYWNILEKVKGSTLRLTKIDDEIYEHFQKDFPDWDATATINEDDMKSKAGKEKWRNFINVYDKKIEDFNFGAMVRASPKTDYTQEGTIFAVRMQFYAIEIARNRQGLNDWVYEQAHQGK
ncbi:hypothetical protein SLS61_006203 [Didymella pomorum]